MVLALFMALPVFAQDSDSCGETPSVHIVDSKDEIQLLEDNGCENIREIHIALKKDHTQKKFQFLIVNNYGSYKIDIKNIDESIKGSVFHVRDFKTNGINFGGDFELKGFRFYGGGEYQKGNRFRVDHNQEYRILKIDLDRFSIEPMVHQYIQFQQLNFNPPAINILAIQPLSLGAYLKKNTPQSGMKVEISVGPEFSISSGPAYDQPQYKLAPAVNLRVSIPLEKKKKKK